MTAWTPHQLEKIGSTDDFHISPYRDDDPLVRRSGRLDVTHIT